MKKKNFIAICLFMTFLNLGILFGVSITNKERQEKVLREIKIYDIGKDYVKLEYKGELYRYIINGD